MAADQPLRASLEGDELVIRIGTATLSHAAEHCPQLVPQPGKSDPPYCKVDDPEMLVRDVCRELQREEEDGTTPLHDLLDEAIAAAFDDGSLAFEE